MGAPATSDLAIVLLISETDKFDNVPPTPVERDMTQTAAPTDETQIHSSRGIT